MISDLVAVLISLLPPPPLNPKNNNKQDSSIRKRCLFWWFPRWCWWQNNLPANTEDAGNTGSIPGLGRFCEIGNGNPLQYSCLENSMDRGDFSYSPWGLKESDMTELTCTHAPHTHIHAIFLCTAMCLSNFYLNLHSSNMIS